jgi:hypothetical protein
MIMTEARLFELSIAEAGRKLRDGSITSRALTEDALARINAIDPALNSFITVTTDRARADATAADANFAEGIDRGPIFRFRSGGRRRAGAHGNGIGYGRLDPRPRRLLRHNRTEAHLWPRFPSGRVPAFDNARPLRSAILDRGG